MHEHNPLKSNHQATDVVKHLYTYRDHFMDFKNPEILASAFNYRELLIKEILLVRGGARGVPGGPLPPKNFAWPPSGPPKIFKVSF